MKKLLLVVLALVSLFLFSCTEYKARQAEKQRIQDSIYVARQDSAKRAEERRIFVRDSLMARKQFVQDSIKKEQERQKHIQDSILKAKRLYEIKHSVKILKARLGYPNSAGGVDAYVEYKNISNKTIKYLVWEGYPINAVGDRVSCEIRGYGEFRGEDTGPIQPGGYGGGVWDCAWYNYSARELVITSVYITYMDDSRLNIYEDEMKYIWNKK